ncbi:MAG: (2Fe-2S)-binding protein [Hydrocarboniphaga sp.]|uniref:(2Fe-2S)-binding protein n=1 Tax=Hydrocarboniphaga sp. TaxID=2033016 RepID=UPI00263718B6|nr:(2Fe-2S)-binding protein [Hydrocarboniphaga sp.]MDB5972937.1 (2Fe-2S)-binding protein [Hydrocarboniphaga sp.]
MYVCVCKAVSDTRIKRLVSEGACTLRDLSRETALGTCCGICVPAARQVLSEALSAQPIRLSDLGARAPMTAAAA